MAEVVLNPGVTTWDELRPPDGNVLLIVNSVPGDREPVALALSELERYAGPAALHVVADPSWGPWFGARGLSGARVRLTDDDNEQSVDLNHFLESPAATLWIVPRQFRVIVGSSAHSLYNEEVKEIFEQRVCLLLGDGRFIAHALPHRYLAILDLAALVRRFGRRERTDEYLGRCRSLVQDCHAAWLGQGSPRPSDSRPALDMLKLVGRHFGNQILQFDEGAPAPMDHGSEPKDLETLGLYYRTVLHAHDETLTALYHERNQAVALRDRMLAELQAERNQAVDARDAIIADHQREIDFLTHGWRRWVVKRR